MATAVVPSTQINKPLIRGWLQKKSRHMKKWRKRWVILQKSAIYTFKAETNTMSQATEIIDLRGCIYIKPSSNVESSSKSSDLVYAFELHCHNLSFTFHAETLDSMNEWMKCIQHQLFITSLKPKPTKSKPNDGICTEKLWVCSACAYQNSLSSHECTFCGNNKRQETRVVSPSIISQHRLAGAQVTITFTSKPLGCTLYNGDNERNAWIADIQDGNPYLEKGLRIGLYVHTINNQIVDNNAYAEILTRIHETSAPLVIGFNPYPPLNPEDETILNLQKMGFTFLDCQCAWQQINEITDTMTTANVQFESKMLEILQQFKQVNISAPDHDPEAAMDVPSDDVMDKKEENEENVSHWQCSMCTYANIDILPFCEICGANKPQKKQIRRKYTHLSASEVSKDIKDNECKFNYVECPCIQRIVTILEFYQKWLIFKQSKDNQQVLDLAVYQKEIYGNSGLLLRLQSAGNVGGLYSFISQIFDNYSNVLLLDDFNHVLDYHCNEQQHDTEKVCVYLLSRFKINGSECRLSTCVCAKRNHKTDANHVAKRNEIYFVNDEENEDKRHVVTQQILDRIHCRLVHSFELFEFTDIEDKQIRDAVHLDDVGKEALHLNHNRLKTIQNIVKRKGKNMSLVRNAERIEHSKYTTQIASEDDDVTISFGRRCFYWTFYGSNRWYIFAKYDGLKTELLNNTQQNISLTEYNDLYLKCELLLKCSKCKQLSCKEQNILNFKYYGLNAGQLFTIDHIMAMLLYCNHDILCHSFVSTFTTPIWDLNSFKKSHREYSHWARLMREICECFGNALDSKCGSYYHGISSQQLLFSDTIKLCKPTSCSSTLSVSLQYLFANDNGLILEVEKNENISDATYYFDASQCSVFSDFAEEMEVIFMGGHKSLKLSSILNMVRAESYKIYLYAIRCLQHLIIGHHPNAPLTRSSMTALANLIQNEIKKEEEDEKSEMNCLPQYIANLFHFCVVNIQYKITLKMDDLDKYYRGAVADIFMEPEHDWCKLDVVLSLFPNVDKICVKKLVCTETTMVKLYTFCESINLNKNNKYSDQANHTIKLNEIMIVDAILQIDVNDHQYMQQIKTLFVKNAWNIHIQIHSNVIRLWK
eukprot:58466_1